MFPRQKTRKKKSPLFKLFSRRKHKQNEEKRKSGGNHALLNVLSYRNNHHLLSFLSFQFRSVSWLFCQFVCPTVWFSSTATKDEDIMQKLDKLAKFWKKPLEDESLQFFAGRFQGFSVKKMIILILVPLLMRFCKIWNVGKLLKYWLNCFSLNCSHFWTIRAYV